MTIDTTQTQPTPIPAGNPEALAELARFDVPAVQRRLARLFADNPDFRLPNKDRQ